MIYLFLILSAETIIKIHDIKHATDEDELHANGLKAISLAFERSVCLTLWANLSKFT